MLLYHSLAAGISLVIGTSAQTWPTDLVGTWSTKSNQTLTGPGFYDPVNDKLIEPSRTGISYSFTNDGHYEEAYYRAIANPIEPNCPSGIMQWQHGRWVMESNGSLVLSPIKVDGRQLLSEPCTSSSGVYTKYNQSEMFLRYSVYTDPYHNIPRLDLYQFDGSPLQPMYLAFSPPQMLPTTTLNQPSATATTTSSSKLKRALDYGMPSMAKTSLEGKRTAEIIHRIDADRLWWVGLTLTGVGGLLYLGPRRLGIQL